MDGSQTIEGRGRGILQIPGGAATNPGTELTSAPVTPYCTAVVLKGYFSGTLRLKVISAGVSCPLRTSRNLLEGRSVMSVFFWRALRRGISTFR